MGFERGALSALARRPLLALEAFRVYFALRRRLLPAPSRRYLHWRAVTAYGDEKTTAGAHDLLDYLCWRRRMRLLRRGDRWG